MTALSSYSTGTATVSAGGTTVTGTGTIWSGTNARPGDIFQIGNFQSVISDVADTDELTIPPWGGGAQTGVTYKIWHVSPQRFAGATAMQTVNKLVADLSNRDIPVIVGAAETEPDPSLGDDDQYADQPTTGKKWVKVGGVWTYLGIFKALKFAGAWSGATAYTVGDVVTLNGSSYVCVLEHTNHTPPNTTYWQLLASKGDTGSTGATGDSNGIKLAYSTTTTDSDPGAGVFRLNNATPASATAAYIDNTQAGGASITAILDTWDDSTSSTRGYVRFEKTTDPTVWAQFRVTGSIVDGGGYRKVTLTGGAGSGAFTNGDSFAISFNRTGDAGAGSGDMQAANNLSDVANVATAATNLGVVRYGGSQSLTSPQKSQARSNIGMSDGHLPGIGSNTAASTGEIGEVITAGATSGSLTSGVTTAMGSISLTAGDWDISATVQFNASGASTITDYNGAVSLTSASLTPHGPMVFTHRVPASADHSEHFAFPPTQALTNATTSFYLNARSVFTGTAPTVTWSLRARRMR